MKKIVSCFIVFLVFLGFSPNVFAATPIVNSEVSYSANGIDFYSVGEDAMIPWHFNGAQITPGNPPGIFSTQVRLLSQNQQSGVAMIMVDLSTLDNTDTERRNPSEMELEVFLNGGSLGKYQVGDLFSNTSPYLDPSVRMIGVPFLIEGEIGDVNMLEIHVSLPTEASNASRLASVTVNVSFTPIESYTVSYVDGVEDEVIFEDKTFIRIEPGAATPSFGAEPTREGYTFAGWSPSVSETVTSDVVYTATWEPIPTYQVNYTDGVPGEEIFADQVFSNLTAGSATPIFNGTPTREGYIFKGWDKEVTDVVTGDVTYTAVWEPIITKEITYRVVYTDGVENESVFDGQVFSDLRAGMATPSFSGTPTREGYKFLGWTPTVSEFVDGDMTYTAQWEKIPKISETVTPPIQETEGKKEIEKTKITERTKIPAISQTKEVVTTKAVPKVSKVKQITYTKVPIKHHGKVSNLPKTAEQAMYSNALIGLGMAIVLTVGISWLHRKKSAGK
ncbi:InlB B-repeat-containing protein [Enterococcus sp. DIV1298c]|uniref:InlB B-repeat-containing protein n=1 Tax=Enterococcus sp. DIV1298c TaxID=2815328 RepID=UPI001A93506E|nr:InlB B-repeat-containing protein [Enterococcus sp. DIV1298c]MBO0462771.1 InlB B-repeat-containing protein [Enterococcus sp. DIV1298c]